MLINSWYQKRDYWQAKAKLIDPSIRLYTKDSVFWDLFPNSQSTASVYGPLHFYPSDWTSIEHELYHEGRHTIQQRWFGLGISPWLGLVPFAIISIFFRIPFLVSVLFYLEMDAEQYALKYKHRKGSSSMYCRYTLVEFAETLCTADYLWSFNKSLARKIAVKRSKKLWPEDNVNA